MRKRIYFFVPLIAITLFIVYFCCWSPAAAQQGQVISDPYQHRDGRREAEADLAAGKLVLVTFGLPVVWSPEYREILLKKTGIEKRTIAGCEVTQPLLDYAAAYNRVMQERIDETFDRTVFKDVEKEAMALYEKRHPKSGL